MHLMSGFQKSFQNAKQKCDSAINQGLNCDCDNPAIVLKVAGERRLIEYKHRFCGKQSSDTALENAVTSMEKVARTSFMIESKSRKPSRKNTNTGQAATNSR